VVKRERAVALFSFWLYEISNSSIGDSGTGVLRIGKRSRPQLQQSKQEVLAQRVHRVQVKAKTKKPTLAGWFVLSDGAMSTHKIIGKALLTVVLPPAFAVVTSIILSALFATIGYLMGHNTFTSCFQGILGNITVLMCLVSLVATLTYFSNKK